MLLWSSTVKYCKYFVAPSSDLTKNFTSVPNILTILYRMSDCVIVFKSSRNDHWTDHSLPQHSPLPNVKFRWPSHITSGNFTICSRTAFTLHIQIHKSNSHWLFHNTVILCFVEWMWRLYLAIPRVWVSGNFSFHHSTLLYRQIEV